MWLFQIFDEPPEKKKKTKVSVQIEEAGGEGGETYDRDQKMERLLKFNTTIKRCPSQVIRIAYPGGFPLSPVAGDLPRVPPCSCGKARVFEVQLLPTILSFITEEEEINLAALKDVREWSSVLVYTCEGNCNAAAEAVVVLPPLSLLSCNKHPT